MNQNFMVYRSRNECLKINFFDTDSIILGKNRIDVSIFNIMPPDHIITNEKLRQKNGPPQNSKPERKYSNLILGILGTCLKFTNIVLGKYSVVPCILNFTYTINGQK